MKVAFQTQSLTLTSDQIQLSGPNTKFRPNVTTYCGMTGGFNKYPFTIDCSKPAPFVYFRPFHNAKTVWKFCQITLTVGGRNTVQLVSCLTRLDLTNKENMLFVGSGAVESKLVKLETSRTVKLPQIVSVPRFNNLHDVVVLKIWTQ